MADCDEYQDAYVALVSSVPDRHRLTEDVCEAFAAAILLPPTDQDPQQQGFALDARGLQQMANAFTASREAGAVWVSHHMAAPGYALLCREDGTLQFAARSGDAVPLQRGASQSGSALQPLLDGRMTLRGRGRFRFGAGSYSQELYFDAVRDGGLIYCVATTDSPDWPVLHQAFKGPEVEAVEAWCEDCAVSFRAYRVCAYCDAPKHSHCGKCECEVATGDRVCEFCFLAKHPNLFDGASDVCRECLA